MGIENNKYIEECKWGIIFDKSKVDLNRYESKNISNVDYQKVINFVEEKVVNKYDLFRVLWGILLQKYNNANEACFLEIIDEDNVFFVKLCSEIESSLESLLEDYISSKGEFEYKKTQEISEESIITSQFDVILWVSEQKEGMSICMKYDEDKYSSVIIDSLANTFAFMINQLIVDSDKPVNQVDRNINIDKIMLDFNNTNESIPQNKTVIDLFEERVMTTPDDVGMIFGDEKITFKQLNLNADNLANKLMSLGIKEGDFVPLYAARGIELIVGILGILKVGGAYIPISDNNSALNIISECSPRVIVCYKKKINGTDDILCVEVNYDTNLGIDIESVNVHPKLNSVASCIYTSGSTGKSKGVLLTHLGLLNTVLTNIKVYELTLADVVLQFSNYTYAQSIIDIFTGIIASKLCIISDEDDKDMYAIEKVCDKNSVTVMALTPSLISELNPNRFKTVRILDSTGELAKSDILIKWTKHCEVLNSYGSTELTGNTSVYKVKGDEKGVIPIGKPIFNNRYYILDRYNKICDIGMMGELYIEGVGISKGYLNDANLTDEKFIINPITGKRAFKSGDMARWLPDGSVEHLGRLDKQVKIRGIRINLDSIKKVIDEIDMINNSLVTVNIDEKGDKVICAYLISDEKIDISQVKRILIDKLPIHMVPVFITQIDKILLNKNAKVDFTALPKPRYEYINEAYLQPTTQNEKILANLICKELKLERVSIENRFVEIGGDSIKAMRIVASLRKFGYKLLVSKLISDDKLFNVAKSMPIILDPKEEKKKNISSEDLSIINEFYNIQEVKTVLNLSPLQLGMLYECIQNNEKNMYINQLKIENLYNSKRVLQIIKILEEKYPILTSNVMYEKIDRPLQVVFHNKGIDFEYIRKDDSCASNWIDIIIDKQATQKMDIQRDSLLRIRYLEGEDESGTLVLTYHHIILDGWSVDLLVKQFLEMYKNPLGAIDICNDDEGVFEDYEIYNQMISNRDDQEAIDYWKTYLKGFDNSNSLPFASIIDKESDEYNYYTDKLDTRVLNKLGELSKKYNVTVSNILESAWGILLSEYSGSKDVVFGRIISGREDFAGNIDKQIGFFINTIPVRSNYNQYESFIDIVKANRDKALNSSEYNYCSLAQIQKETGKKDLIKITFSVENYYDEDEDNDNGIIVEEIGESTSCPLTVAVSFAGKRANIKITYNTGIYNQEKISRIYNNYIHILNTMVNAPELKIACSELILDTEKVEVLEKFNDTKVDFGNTKTFIELFEKQVEKTPDNIAIVCGNQKITYSELNNRANCIAYKLREFGVGADDLVPLITKRSVEMIVGIYGILKAGGGYVPIDHKFPKERIDYIIKDCNAKVVLKYAVDVKTNLPEIDLGDTSLYTETAINPECVSGLDNYVYSIYTSGTTGNPKGVININRGMINLLLYMNKEYTLCEEDVILQKASYTFDASVWEITWWAITGASVSLLSPSGEQEPNDICETIKNTDVTVIQFVPSMLNMFLEYMEKHANEYEFSKIKYLLTIGEPLNINTVRRIVKLFDSENGHLRIINTYGPTEASVLVTTYECKADMDMILIGKPIDNVQIYIANNEKLCGVGMVGEICIAGEALALGYLNRKELTDAKFADNLFAPGKMYYTGDIARWLLDGNIEIFGRMDDQIKIRGCRIELAEIESKIRDIENIKDCAVIAKKDSSDNNAIYAYVVSDETINEVYIKEQLGYKLPEYMVPAYIGRIDAVPVTTSGKLDRRSLPELNINRIDTYVAPSDKEETILCKMYEDILKFERVGVKDNFFSLGGHSLLAISLINQIDSKLGVKLKIHDIFESPSIEKLARRIKEKSNDEFTPIPVAEEKDFYETSSLQKRIFLLNEMDPSSLSYNITEVFRMRGEIDKDRMRNAVQELVDRYEILRTNFVNIDGKLYQRIHKDVKLSFMLIENDVREDGVIINEFVRPFDLSEAPLFRVSLVEKEGYYLLLMDIHHIVGDGESIKKFMKELSHIYSKK